MSFKILTLDYKAIITRMRAMTHKLFPFSLSFQGAICALPRGIGSYFLERLSVFMWIVSPR